jgi:predicted amidohydrolase
MIGMNKISLSAKPRLKMAAVQVNNVRANTKSEQISIAERHISLAEMIQGNVNLVLFPEASTVGQPLFSSTVCENGIIETLDGPVTRLFKEAAKRFNMLIGFGLPRLQGDKIFDSYVIVGPEGESVVCDKFSCTILQSGSGYTGFSYNGLKIGLTVCHDAHIEGINDGLVRGPHDLILIPCYTNTAHLKELQFKYWKSHALTINYAEEDGGCSTFYNYFEGPELSKVMLFRDEGILLVDI